MLLYNVFVSDLIIYSHCSFFIVHCSGSSVVPGCVDDASRDAAPWWVPQNRKMIFNNSNTLGRHDPIWHHIIKCYNISFNWYFIYQLIFSPLVNPVWSVYAWTTHPRLQPNIVNSFIEYVILKHTPAHPHMINNVSPYKPEPFRVQSQLPIR